MNPIQAHPSTGVVVPPHDAESRYASDAVVGKPGTNSYITTEAEGRDAGGEDDDAAAAASAAASAAGNPVSVGHVQAQGQWFEYLKTKQFWVTLLLGQVLAICITATNTLSTLLANHGTSIPAFQTLFNYVLLNLIYTTYTIYRYGWNKWLRLLVVDGWRFFILAFFDVEGNYFVVLAYRYTTILSAQLINFWAIAVVVIISFLFLHVRYHYTQILGILLCIGGLGVIFGSDQLTGANAMGAPNAVKGDLFALLGASCYGLSNVLEEWLVSERALFEVVGQLAWWGMWINGAQAGIFDRAAFAAATWSPRVAAYLVAYTLILALFYSLAPVLFRLSSAAFFNISLLTGSFWGVAIGVRVFGLHIHWMYPIAFVLILLGQVLYFLRQSMVGEALKPWLGARQQKGHAGIGTAKRRVERPGAIV